MKKISILLLTIFALANSLALADFGDDISSAASSAQQAANTVQATAQHAASQVQQAVHTTGQQITQRIETTTSHVAEHAQRLEKRLDQAKREAQKIVTVAQQTAQATQKAVQTAAHEAQQVQAGIEATPETQRKIKEFLQKAPAIEAAAEKTVEAAKKAEGESKEYVTQIKKIIATATKTDPSNAKNLANKVAACPRIAGQVYKISANFSPTLLSSATTIETTADAIAVFKPKAAEQLRKIAADLREFGQIIVGMAPEVLEAQAAIEAAAFQLQEMLGGAK